jgi:aromatic ring hydroxylase
MTMNKNNLKMIPCIACGEDMPELRLTKFGYKVCVNCSEVGAYRAVSTVHGSGDHTYNDIQIMTPEQYESYEKVEKLSSKTLKSLSKED